MAEAEETTAQNAEPLTPVSLNILKVILEARKRYGVNNGDFKVYRKYCHKHLHRLRSRLNLNCVDELNKFLPKPKPKNTRKKKGGKKGMGLSLEEEKAKEEWNPKYKKKRPPKVIKYTYRKVDSSDVKRESGDEIMIPLFLAERAWVYSQELYEQFDADHKRKYHHSNSRLRKAIVWSRSVNQLCLSRGDGATQLHGYAYMKYIEGCHQLQKQMYEEALGCFTQTSFIYQSFAATHDESRFLYLEQINTIAVKLAFLQQTAVDKAKAQTIAAEAKASVQQRFSAQLEEVSKLAAEAAANSAMDDMKSGDTPMVQFQGTKAVIKLAPLQQLMAQFEKQLKQLGSQPIWKRGSLYLKVLTMCEEALHFVREELKKYASGIAEGARPLYVIEQYLHFQQLRLSVARLESWRQSRVAKLTSKDSKNSNHNNSGRLWKHLLFYDLAQLCEEEIKHLDTIYTVGDADKHTDLQSDIQCLRASYQLQRLYYIAKVYFYNSDYNAAAAIFQSTANECNTFANEFQWKGRDNSSDEMQLNAVMDIGCMVDIARHQSLIANVGKDSHKLYLLSRANAILTAEERQQQTTSNTTKRDLVSRSKDFSVSGSEALHVSSIGLDIQPLLPKPVMYDLAWNYVDYEGREHTESATSDEDTDTQTDDTTASKKWFGIF